VKLLAFSRPYVKSQGEKNPRAVLALLLDDPLNRFSDCCFEALLSFSFGPESAADLYLSLVQVILDHPKVASVP
jgi:hypothetical protein